MGSNVLGNAECHRVGWCSCGHPWMFRKGSNHCRSVELSERSGMAFDREFLPSRYVLHIASLVQIFHLAITIDASLQIRMQQPGGATNGARDHGVRDGVS